MRLRLPMLAAIVSASALLLAACGSDDDSKSDTKSASQAATPVNVTITQAGKGIAYEVPASVKGGLVTLNVQNNSTAPHGAQLVRIEGDHTTQEALKVVNSDSEKTPDFVRAEGGLGAAPPNGKASATLNLKAGKYLVVDSGGPGASGPPAYKEFTVTSGTEGEIPSAPVTITAENPAKDKYKWNIQGDLKTGQNNVLFVSKGDEAIHFIGAFRVTGNPSLAEIKKGLGSNGPPPKFIDQSSFYTTAVLDGGLSQTTPLPFQKPGEYVLFCPLSDREGGPGHDKQGLLTTVTIK